MSESTAETRRITTSSVIQYGLMFLLLWFIFFRLLPGLIDYREVLETILSLEWWQFLLLLLLAAMRDFSESAVYTNVVPGMGYWKGWQVYSGSTAMASLAPPGVDFAVRYAMYRSFGIQADRVGEGMILSAVFTLGVKWGTPLIALILVLITQPGFEPGTLYWLIFTVAASIITAGFLVLRSRTTAGWLGRTIEVWNNQLLANHWKFKPLEDLENKMVGYRDDLLSTLRGVWPVASLAAITSQTLSFIILVLAMRFVGISGDEASLFELFVAFAIGLIASMVPILPQGLGAVEMVYVWILAGEVGTDLANQIAAAAFVHRIFLWFLPMIVGLVPLYIWNRRMKKEPAQELAVD